MTSALGVFWMILKQQVSCFFYSKFRSKGLSLGGLKNCTNFKISFRIFRRLSTGTFDLEKRMITSLLLMITHRMHRYILEVPDLVEKLVSALHCLMILFYYSHCLSNYSITSRDCNILSNLSGSRHAANYMSRFQRGWLAIAKVKPLTLFISLSEHCQMLSWALIIEKWKVKVVLA